MKEKCQGDKEALIVDMSSINKCKDLLLLSDGTIIQPVLNKNMTNLVKSKIISFNYKKTNTPPTCIHADFMAKITCINYKEKRNVILCNNEMNVDKINWLKPYLSHSALRNIFIIIDIKNTYYIISYLDKNELYDCKGTLKCTYKNEQKSECASHILKGLNKKIIFTNEYRQD